MYIPILPTASQHNC